jgi:hypothetical protein
VYFETAQYFIAGTDGKFEIWTGNREQGTENKEKRTENREQRTTDELRDEFKGYVERLIGLADYLNSTGRTPAERLLKELAGRIKDKPLVCAASIGYALLAMLRPFAGGEGRLAADLAFDHWGFDRKLREQYRVFGASDDEAWRLGEINRVALRRTGAAVAAGGNGGGSDCTAASIIEENYLEDDFRKLIGINVFDDVAWFNKESFESALFYGKLFFVIENDGAFSRPMPWLERVGRIAEMAEAFEKAEAASGYQLDSLIRLLNADGVDAKIDLKIDPKINVEKKPSKKTGKGK